VKKWLAKVYAKMEMKRVYKDASHAVSCQNSVLNSIVTTARNTAFGKDHNFKEIQNYASFKQNVPVRDYEGLKKYVDRIVAGEENVLWPGFPLYLCKTSGTTSGAKYIPLTKESMPEHIKAAKRALLSYINNTGNADFVQRKMIFLQGSPELEVKGKVNLGRLSGIVAHYVPKYLQTNRLPSYKANCITDWEEKIDAIVEETLNEDMGVISGIPPWVQMYFERIKEKTNGKTIGEVFKNFELFVYGGVSFEPYRDNFRALIGGEVPSVELYPASEGFIAFQDKQNERGMLLNVNAGMFYEFIELEYLGTKEEKRISLEEVELEKNYVLLLTTNAGLYAYNIGDTVKFVSLNPYRIIVSGRVKHFTSAFGEHVIAEEVEYAMLKALEAESAKVSEFTVAPQVSPKNGLPYHEWFIEFAEEPNNFNLFVKVLDEALQNKNVYYKDLITGSVLEPLHITVVKQNGFTQHMKNMGKLGGQNKVPRLTNSRDFVKGLERMGLKEVVLVN
jgi:hypothetical protein